MKDNNQNIVTALKESITKNQNQITSLQNQNEKFKDVLSILSRGKKGRPVGMKKKKTGFASMSMAARKRIASMGGRASQIKIKKLKSKAK